MALFGRDYDRDYGRDYDPGMNFGRRRNPGVGESAGYLGGRRPGTTWSGEDDRAYYRSMHGYTSDPDVSRGMGSRYDRGYTSQGYTGQGYSGARYDRGYRTQTSTRYDQGYDRPYKSQWQTDYGDPFGDRQARTPMRVIRGPFDERYDREFHDDEGLGGWTGSSRNRYERDYSSNPMGYDPYRSRESSMERGWGMRDMNRDQRYGRDYRW